MKGGYGMTGTSVGRSTGQQSAWVRAAGLVGVVMSLAVACSDGSDSSNTDAAAGSAGSSDAAGTGGSAGAASTTDCASASTHIDKVVCASEAFLATLDDTQKTSVQYAFTDSVAKTRWSNLPGVQRNGVAFGDLSETSLAAAKALAATVLSADGYSDFLGVLAADDYLASQQSTGGGMGGPGGGAYSSGNAKIAFLGTPSATTDWMLQIGNHHMAYNITYVAGVGYPTPNHVGAEPKGTFTINGSSYDPLGDEADAVFGLFKSLDSTQLTAAYLKGPAFADVLLGPDEYATGAYPTDSYPAGANRTGVLVSSLTSDQQALVKTAIELWVGDFDSAISDSLLADYTTTEAFADTYIAWGGTEASGLDADVTGTYLRSDGPRVWIELSAQGGVVIQGQTHFHTIYRDKAQDYGHSL